jgi:hypothetical protein
VIDQSVAFVGCERSRKVLHHARVGIETREGLAVASSPAAQMQAGRLHDHPS